MRCGCSVTWADVVGASHSSYTYAGHQWGLATDAACQVAAVRVDLLEAGPPATWDEVLELARAQPGRVALPLAPGHAISSFLTLCANAGEPAAARCSNVSIPPRAKASGRCRLSHGRGIDFSTAA